MTKSEELAQDLKNRNLYIYNVWDKKDLIKALERIHPDLRYCVFERGNSVILTILMKMCPPTEVYSLHLSEELLEDYLKNENMLAVIVWHKFTEILFKNYHGVTLYEALRDKTFKGYDM